MIELVVAKPRLHPCIHTPGLLASHWPRKQDYLQHQLVDSLVPPELPLQKKKKKLLLFNQEQQPLPNDLTKEEDHWKYNK